MVWPRVWYGRSVVRPHQGSLSGEAWFRAHVCVAADEAGKKENRTRARAGWQIFDLLKAGYTFERDSGFWTSV